MAQKLAQISGVGMVSIAGGQRPAVRIRTNPEALAAYGLSLADVRSLITSSNVNQPKGNFDGPTRVSMLDANDQLKTPEEYAELILTYQDGAALRLKDVADIVDGAENERLAAWANDSQAVLLNIQRQPGQRHRGGRAHPGAVAGSEGQHAGRAGRGGAHRPHPDHPRRSAGRAA